MTQSQTKQRFEEELVKTAYALGLGEGVCEACLHIMERRSEYLKPCEECDFGRRANELVKRVKESIESECLLREEEAIRSLMTSKRFSCPACGAGCNHFYFDPEKSKTFCDNCQPGLGALNLQIP